MKLIENIWEAVMHIIGVVIMTAVLTLFVGALFAPGFERLFTRDLQAAAIGDRHSTLESMATAHRKLFLTRIGLWITAGFAWAFLIVTNLYYHRIIF